MKRRRELLHRWPEEGAAYGPSRAGGAEAAKPQHRYDAGTQEFTAAATAGTARGSPVASPPYPFLSAVRSSVFQAKEASV